MSRWPLAAALLVAASAARAEVLAPGPGSAPPGRAEAPAAPPEVAATDRAWNVCRVSVSVLLNTAGHSKVVSEQRQLLAIGESVDVQREVPLTDGSRHALVRLRARVTATIARTPGVLYTVTSDAELVSALGFSSPDVGREQVRTNVLDIAGPGTSLHEAWVSPELGARLVVAVAAEPVFGREEVRGLAALAPPSGRLWELRVEALTKEDAKETLLETTRLQAALGMETSFSLSHFGAGAAEVHPALRLGSSVRLVEPRRVGSSGYEDRNVVTLEPADTSFVASHAVEQENRWLEGHVVETDREDEPRHFTIRRANRKISEKKRQQLLDAQRIALVREWVIERSKTLPSGEDVPEGFDREELSLEVVPLHATASTLQAEIRVRGRVRLPRETERIEVAATWVELLPIGQTFEISVAELVRDGEQKYDYLLRITPQQP